MRSCEWSSPGGPGMATWILSAQWRFNSRPRPPRFNSDPCPRAKWPQRPNAVTPRNNRVLPPEATVRTGNHGVNNNRRALDENDHEHAFCHCRAGEIQLLIRILLSTKHPIGILFSPVVAPGCTATLGNGRSWKARKAALLGRRPTPGESSLRPAGLSRRSQPAQTGMMTSARPWPRLHIFSCKAPTCAGWVLAGFAMGTGEVTPYLGRPAASRLVGPVRPWSRRCLAVSLVRTDDNPEGYRPGPVFDAMYGALSAPTCPRR